MARVRQRDANLAHQLLSAMDLCGQVARKLLDNQGMYGPVTDSELRLLDHALFDSMANLRDWGRRRSVIEQKGQRG